MKKYKIQTRYLITILFIFSSYPLWAQRDNYLSALSGTLSSVEVFDVKQNKKVKIHTGDKPLSLFVFLSPECPLCQNYTKTLNELEQKYKPQVNLAGIIPGEAYTLKDITDFENKYHINFRLFVDAKQELTRFLRATVTPEAILLDSSGNLVYIGAIDDWLFALGKKKLHVSKQYLQEAIEQSLKGEPVKTKRTNAFGCKINDF